MFTRVSIVAAFFVLSSVDLLAAEKHATSKVGDMVVINMTGDLAKEYATRTGGPNLGNAGLSGVSISLPATIAQRRPDGKYRIECSVPIASDKKPARMLTLSSIVDPKLLKTDVVPKNTPVYSSPGDAKNGKRPYLTETAETLLHVDLSNLRDTKLQTWALVDEVGEQVR